MKVYRPTYTTRDGTRKQSRKYWVRFSVQGRRFDKPPGTSDKQAAALRAS